MKWMGYSSPLEAVSKTDFITIQSSPPSGNTLTGSLVNLDSADDGV